MCFATQGHGHIEEERIRDLLEPLRPTVYPFDRAHKLRAAAGLVRAVRAQRPQLVVMEGTGTAGGLTLIALNAFGGVPFVVSSGDAVGPYLGLQSRLLGLLGGVYERLLCQRCAGFGAGRLTLSAERSASERDARSPCPVGARGQISEGAREKIRDRLRIAEDAIVVGIVGTLHWNERLDYGMEPARARAAARTAARSRDLRDRRRFRTLAATGDGGRRSRQPRPASRSRTAG